MHIFCLYWVKQAESTEELKQWMSSIRRCIENELVNNNGSRTSSADLLRRLAQGGGGGGESGGGGGDDSGDFGEFGDDDERTLLGMGWGGDGNRRRSRSRSNGSNYSVGGVRPEVAELMELNPTCADCRAPDPDWASINLGVVVCIACSGVHRLSLIHI